MSNLIDWPAKREIYSIIDLMRSSIIYIVKEERFGKDIIRFRYADRDGKEKDGFSRFYNKGEHFQNMEYDHHYELSEF